MQIGKLSQGILNMKIDTFDSRTTPSEGKIPGLAVDNPLGLGSGGKSKNSKKKVRTTNLLYIFTITVKTIHTFSYLKHL